MSTVLKINPITAALNVIKQESEAIKNLNAIFDENFIKLIELICNCKGKVICSGVGKSGIVSQKLSSTFSSVGIPSFYLHPTEAAHGDLGIISSNDIIIVSSNSGETEEVFSILQFCKRFNITLIAITSNPNSTIARSSSIAITLPETEEISHLPVPTTSFTNAIVFGDCLLAAIMQEKSIKIEHYKNFHPGGSIGYKLLKAQDALIPVSKLPLIDEELPYFELLNVISNGGLGCALVVRSDTLQGIITDGDIRRFIIENSDNFTKATAKDVMTPSPKCIDKDEYLEKAIFIMNSKKITHLPVLNGDKLLGLLQIHSVLAPQNYIT